MRNALVIRPCGVGDTVLMLPFLDALRAARVTFMGNPERSGFLSGRTSVEDVISIDSFGAPSLFSGDPSAQAREFLSGFELVVAFWKKGREEFRASLKRAGVKEAHVLDAFPRAGQHACDRAAEMASELGLPAAGPTPRLRVLDADIERAKREGLEEGIFVIHPGSGNPEKNWPLESFAGLAGDLHEEHEVVFLAGPAEEERLDEIRSAAPGRVLASPDWQTLVGTLAIARAYVGNDCGITHLSAAVGTPTVALFGPTNPVMWGPRGEKVRVLRDKEGRLSGISPRDVLAALDGLERSG